MSDSLSPAERLRRRYKPDPARELLADFRAELAAISDPAQAQELFDAAADVAGNLVTDSRELNVLVDRLHQVAFPAEPGAATEGHRRQALDRHPELADVYAAVEGAESDAEKAEIVAAAISSGRFDGDDVATIALLGLDPTIDKRLATDDPEAAAEADRAETDRLLTESAAGVTPTESPAQRMLREHLEAAEAAAVEAETVDA
jgi:hypothetical protein